MEFKAVIEKRRSVRKYRTDPVPEDLLAEMVRLATQAPSAGALRAYEIIVTDEQLTPYKAPMSFVICAVPRISAKRYGKRGEQLYAIQDATIVGAYLQLIAVDMGLSTVWVGAFREGRVRQALQLGDDLRPIAIIPVGYRAWN